MTTIQNLKNNDTHGRHVGSRGTRLAREERH